MDRAYSVLIFLIGACSRAGATLAPDHDYNLENYVFPGEVIQGQTHEDHNVKKSRFIEANDLHYFCQPKLPARGNPVGLGLSTPNYSPQAHEASTTLFQSQNAHSHFNFIQGGPPYFHTCSNTFPDENSSIHDHQAGLASPQEAMLLRDNYPLRYPHLGYLGDTSPGLTESSSVSAELHRGPTNIHHGSHNLPWAEAAMPQSTPVFDNPMESLTRAYSMGPTAVETEEMFWDWNSHNILNTYPAYLQRQQADHLVQLGSSNQFPDFPADYSAFQNRIPQVAQATYGNQGLHTGDLAYQEKLDGFATPEHMNGYGLLDTEHGKDYYHLPTAPPTFKRKRLHLEGDESSAFWALTLLKSKWDRKPKLETTPGLNHQARVKTFHSEQIKQALDCPTPPSEIEEKLFQLPDGKMIRNAFINKVHEPIQKEPFVAPLNC